MSTDFEFLQNKTNNPSSSSSSDCVLTIHHRYKHKRSGTHHTTTSIEKSVLSNDQPLDTSRTIMKEKSTNNSSRQNSTPKKESKASELFKLLSSSDNATKHRDEEADSSFEETLDDTEFSYRNDEMEMTNDDQLNPLTKSERELASSNDLPLKKNMARINHYPNMLADFD